MTITMADGQPVRPVMDLPETEIEHTVRTAPGRPCAAPGNDPEDWFPAEPPAGHYQHQREAYEARARALCRFCPVELACLELAISYERGTRGAGIWGGQAPWQRQSLARNRSARLAVTS